jgi:hypothetical protein
MDPRAPLTLVVAVSLCGAAQAQSLFKCVQPDGKVVYQDSKCPEETKQSTVRPPDERPAAPPPKEPAPGAKADGPAAPAITTQAVIEVIANFQGCAEQFPAFASKYGAAYQQWRQKNSAALSRYEQDGEARRKVRESLDFQRREAASDSTQAKADKLEVCENAIAPLVEGKSAQR